MKFSKLFFTLDFQIKVLVLILPQNLTDTLFWYARVGVNF